MPNRRGTAAHTLLAAYHDLYAPARMLMPSKQGVAPLHLSSDTISDARAPSAAGSLRACTNLSGRRARGVTVSAGQPIWSLPNNETELESFAQMMVRHAPWSALNLCARCQSNRCMLAVGTYAS